MRQAKVDVRSRILNSWVGCFFWAIISIGFFSIVPLIIKYYLPYPNPSSHSNLTASQQVYLAIQPGMTENQVESILGGPRGCYGTKKYHRLTPISGVESDGTRMSYWYFDDCKILIYFDHAGFVRYTLIDPPIVPARRL
jgi:hypothetical protein